MEDRKLFDWILQESREVEDTRERGACQQHPSRISRADRLVRQSLRRDSRAIKAKWPGQTSIRKSARGESVYTSGLLATANRRQTPTLKYLQERANGSRYCFTALLCVNLIFRRTSKISARSLACTCSEGLWTCFEMIYGLVSPFSARVLMNLVEGLREKSCLLVDRSSRQVFLQSSSRLELISF